MTAAAVSGGRPRILTVLVTAIVTGLPTGAGAGGGGGATKPTCFPDAVPSDALGTPDPFRPPAARATEQNAAGKTLYRQGKWVEARAAYREALAADPQFLAPQLNIACSFVRQDRFPDALQEVARLVERAYVPWGREVLEAADLGALKPRKEMGELRAIMAAAARRWGAGVDEDGVIYVGRQRPPLRIPGAGAGVFVLHPHQEVYAFLPPLGLHRQLTAEDGRVLLAVRAPDARTIVYVTAEKLIRGKQPDDLALRGVVLRELTIATMSLAPPIALEGDVRRLEILAARGGLAVRVTGDRTNGAFRRDGEQPALIPLREIGRTPVLGALTPRGAAGSAPQTIAGGCPATAREARAADGTMTVVVTPRERTPRGAARAVKIGGTFGAGLVGLPLP